jgi:hypothetical protein
MMVMANNEASAKSAAASFQVDVLLAAGSQRP